MSGIDVTGFLDNIVDLEKMVYRNVFFENRGKRSVQLAEMKILSCAGLFGVKSDYVGRYGERMINEGVGFLIEELRWLGLEDGEIYSTIVDARRNFAKENDLQNFYDVADKKEQLRVYNVVAMGLRDLRNSRCWRK